jgi:PAS domain-containing protein
VNLGAASPEEIVSFALEAFRESREEQLSQLDAVPSPVYATDAEGRVSWFNSACVAFAGRTPVAGSDRWCVSWKLFTTDGRELPHEQCPMAVAIRESRPVRGAEAIARRPDGSQVRFVPYPTPVCDADGTLLGAVNIMVDVGTSQRVYRMREQARRCRRLARGIDDRTTKDTLLGLATDYEQRAEALDKPGLSPARPSA